MNAAQKMTAKAGLLSLFFVLLLFPQTAAAQEKRFLVRYDHGSANLAPWAGLKLYIGTERVRILAGNDMIHDIPVGNITSVTHELRSPFDPAKTTERVFNDTIGSCSNIPDCAVLGPAGVVGAAGVGVATLFTPKEYVITINWLEAGQPREMAMKIAWYQKLPILGAFKNLAGHPAVERLPGRPAPGTAAPPASRSGEVAEAVPPKKLPTQSTATPAPTLQAANAMTTTSGYEEKDPNESPEMIRRFAIILDRAARVGDTQLQAGMYLVLVQERMNSQAMVVFLDNSVQNSPTTKILAKVFADLTAAPESTSVQTVFVIEEGEATRLREIRIPGRVLRFTN